MAGAPTLLRTIDLSGGFVPDPDYELTQVVPVFLTPEFATGKVALSLHFFNALNQPVAGAGDVQIVAVSMVPTGLPGQGPGPAPLIRGAVPELAVPVARMLVEVVGYSMQIGLRLIALNTLAATAQVWWSTFE